MTDSDPVSSAVLLVVRNFAYSFLKLAQEEELDKVCTAGDLCQNSGLSFQWRTVCFKTIARLEGYRRVQRYYI